MSCKVIWEEACKVAAVFGGFIGIALIVCASMWLMDALVSRFDKEAEMVARGFVFIFVCMAGVGAYLHLKSFLRK